jgi:hypothetical protein
LKQQSDFEWWVETVGGATIGFAVMFGFVMFLAFAWVIVIDAARLILEVVR